MFRLRPVLPKYTCTWDPNTVLSYISHWYPLNNLDLEKLTKKTAILLALTTGQRVQTLYLIRYINITFTDIGVNIPITDI